MLDEPNWKLEQRNTSNDNLQFQKDQDNMDGEEWWEPQPRVVECPWIEVYHLG